MTLQAPKRSARCTLTGVPILSGDRVHVEHVPSHRAKPGYLQPTGNLIAAPLTLHRHMPEGVGLVYAVMMAKYLDLAVAEQHKQISMQERLALIAWWDGDYGIDRVRRGLCERLSEDEADHIIQVVVACHHEQADPDVIGQRFGHDGAWVRDRIDYCMRLANRRGRTKTA